MDLQIYSYVYNILNDIIQQMENTLYLHYKAIVRVQYKINCYFLHKVDIKNNYRTIEYDLVIVIPKLANSNSIFNRRQRLSKWVRDFLVEECLTYIKYREKIYAYRFQIIS